MTRTFYIGHSDDRVCTECGEVLTHLDERCPVCSRLSFGELRNMLEEHRVKGSDGFEVWILAIGG